MASTSEIKAHIKSIRDTKKITGAMELIASAKLTKAKAELDATRPYFNALAGEIKRIFRTSARVESRYFYPDEEETHNLNGTYASLVITADKGLAGAYNQNVEKEAEKMLSNHADTKLFVVGECGRQYFSRRGIKTEKTFLYTAQNPTMERAREIADILLELFDSEQAEKILITYTDMQSGADPTVKTTRLLPFHHSQFAKKGEKTVDESFEFEPSVSAVLNNVIKSYVSGFIYSALVDSFCSEQNARMSAMNSAGSSADKLLGELTKEYNAQRQAAITREITEITAGARALKRQKEKR